MLRSLLAAALATAAALCSIDASRRRTTVLYGLIDASGSRSRPPGGDYRWQLDSGNMSRSFLGFRGSEDLGGGLRAVYRLESYLRVDTGATGGYGGDAFWGARRQRRPRRARSAATVLGRNVDAALPDDDHLQSLRRIVRLLAEHRASTSPARCSATAAGTTRSLSQQPARSAARAPRRQRPRDNDAGVVDNGHNYGAQRVLPLRPVRGRRWPGRRSRTAPCRCPPGSTSRPSRRLSATYDFKLVRVYGQARPGQDRRERSTPSTSLFHFGAAVPIGNGLILAAYGMSRGDDRLLADHRPNVLDRLRLLPLEEHRHLRRGVCTRRRLPAVVGQQLRRRRAVAVLASRPCRASATH